MNNIGGPIKNIKASEIVFEDYKKYKLSIEKKIEILGK
jgi:hypothetical protein